MSNIESTGQLTDLEVLIKGCEAFEVKIDSIKIEDDIIYLLNDHTKVFTTHIDHFLYTIASDTLWGKVSHHISFKGGTKINILLTDYSIKDGLLFCYDDNFCGIVNMRKVQYIKKTNKH